MKPLYWTSVLSALILETHLLSTTHSIKALNRLRMMSTERVEICVNDNDGIALVDLYFTGESSLISQESSLETYSRFNRSSSL